MVSEEGVPGAHLSQGIVAWVQVLPPFLDTPTPMPCPPPFDQRSWCHCPIMLLPLTASCGSTSALRKFLPGWLLSFAAQAASGEGSCDTGTRELARPLMEATNAKALPIATIERVFLTNSPSPFGCQRQYPEPAVSPLTLDQPVRSCNQRTATRADSVVFRLAEANGPESANSIRPSGYNEADRSLGGRGVRETRLCAA